LPYYSGYLHFKHYHNRIDEGFSPPAGAHHAQSTFSNILALTHRQKLSIHIPDKYSHSEVSEVMFHINDAKILKKTVLPERYEEQTTNG